MLLSVFLFQILNIGYFTLSGDGYFKGGIIFIVVETLILISMNLRYSSKKKKIRMTMTDLEEKCL